MFADSSIGNVASLVNSFVSCSALSRCPSGLVVEGSKSVSFLWLANDRVDVWNGREAAERTWLLDAGSDRGRRHLRAAEGYMIAMSGCKTPGMFDTQNENCVLLSELSLQLLLYFVLDVDVSVLGVHE